MKRIMALLLSAALLLLALPALAQDMTLEDAIAKVRTTIEIDSALSEFSSSSSNSDGRTMWYLTWSSPENETYHEVSVGIDSFGVICSYYRYYESVITPRTYRSLKTLPELSEEKAIEIAREYLNKFVGESYSKFVFSKPRCSVESDAYCIYFPHYENDIPVEGSYAAFRIDAKSGTLMDYNLSSILHFTYPAPTSIKEAAEAEKVLGERSLRLVYMPFFSDNVITVKPVYTVSSQDYYDAFTLERIKNDIYFLYNDAVAREENASATASGGDSGKYIPTPQEHEEIENVANLITSAQGVEILLKMSELSFPDVTLYHENHYSTKPYYTNDTETKYYLNLSFESSDNDTTDTYAHANALLNAVSGELLSFTSYSDKDSDAPKITIEEAQKNAETFLTKYKGEKFARTRIAETENDESALTATFLYEEYINGIAFPSNHMEVTIDRTNGCVSSYSENFYENLVFTAAVDFLTQEEASQIAAENVGVNLMYFTRYENRETIVSLGYRYASDKGSYILGSDGTLLDYNGEPFDKGNAEAPALASDIEGHVCEDAAKALHAVGVYIKGDILNPDASITQGDFLMTLLMCRNYFSISDAEEAFEYAVQAGIVDAADKSLDSPLTREKGVQYIINMVGAKTISQLEGIFKTGFSDEANISTEHLGAVAIAKAVQIVYGSDGAFFPKRNVTRGETLIMLYNLLKNNVF
ncbi:MAG: hypothetical protein Q4C12_07305 [Clostridia bacterium]|nr:hypothetical protein [Clostridia bacterium]